MDLTGIVNRNEYYTNHYFAAIFADNARATISDWRARARGGIQGSLVRPEGGSPEVFRPQGAVPQEQWSGRQRRVG